MSALQDAIRQQIKTLRFRDDPVPVSKLIQVLDAGRWAYSPGDTKPGRIIVVSDEKKRAELIEKMANSLDEHSSLEGLKEETRYADENLQLFSSAPALIVACMTKEVFSDKPDRWMGEHAMGVQSLAAAIQNMLLVAKDVGLGGFWSPTPLFCPTAVRRALGIPQSVEPQAIIALGYPEESSEYPKMKPFEEAIYLDEWGTRFPI